MKTSFLARFILITLGTVASAQAETALQFHGAVMLEKMIHPVAAAVGAAHGVKLEFVANGAGRGLADLAAGKADVAMLAGDLSDFAAQINEKAPGSIDPAKLKLFPIVEVPAVMIVHPSNPVPALTLEQIRGIYSGKVTNWKELGGPNLPVVIIIAAPTDGVRSVVTKFVMHDTPYAASARLIQLSTDMLKVVAQVPGAVACVSSRLVGPEVRAIKPAQPILVPYALVTNGEPSEALKNVISDLQLRLN